MIFALEEKRTILLEHAKNTTFSSEDTRNFALQQVDAELLRNELEIKTAYDSFEVGYTLVERYSTEMLQGVQPSTAFVLQLVKVSNITELHFSQQSIKMDNCRKKFKKLMSAEMYADFERKRLSSLGRDGDENLEKLLHDIKMHTAEELNLIEVSTSAELWRVENAFASQLEQNLHIHERFAADVEDIVQLHENEKLSLSNAYEREVQFSASEVVNMSLQQNEERERTLNELEQKLISNLSRRELKFTDSLYTCYKNVMGKVLSQVQVLFCTITSI